MAYAPTTWYKDGAEVVAYSAEDAIWYEYNGWSLVADAAETEEVQQWRARLAAFTFDADPDIQTSDILNPGTVTGKALRAELDERFGVTGGGGLTEAQLDAALEDRGVLTRSAADLDYRSAVVLAGAGIDPTGATESTVGIRSRIETAATFGFPDAYLPDGEYVIDSIPLNSSIRITAHPGARLVRKAGADSQQGSYWIAGAAMFEVNAPGLTVEFEGGVYDGNNANQTSIEPTGFFLRTMPTATVTSEPTVVRISRMKFTNGTSGYLALRGDNIQRRYETQVYVDDCVFTDTVFGKGRDDPSTPTALGYHPTYVHVYDYVTLRTRNFSAVFDKPTSLGNYSVCALNATFYGTDYTQSGQAQVFMDGTTYLRGLGRSAQSWNDANQWLLNNGIGALDCYGNADDFYIENLFAIDCKNVPARAKASLRRYTVKTAVLINCHRGLQVGPSSTGPAETAVDIGKVYSYGGTNPQVEVTGTTTAQRIPSASIGAVYLAGPMTMPENNVGEGAVHLRNIWQASVQAAEIHGAPYRGITSTDVDRLDLNGITIDGAGQQGILTINGSFISIDGYDIRNTAAEGVVVSGATGLVNVGNGRASGVVHYGVYQNSPSAKYTHIHDTYAENVTGSGRGMYVRGGDALLSRNSIGTGVATNWLKHGDAIVREDHNSWNPVELWATTPPTAGAYARGSHCWNPSPSVGGPAGWVAVVAGTATTPPVWEPLAVGAPLSSDMTAWSAALATRNTGRVQALVVGDSRGEGSGTTHTRHRWQTRLQAALRSRLGVSGGAEYPFIPAYPQTGSPMPVVRSGEMTQDTSWGIGWRTARMTGDGASLTFTFTGTSFGVEYSRHTTASGVMGIAIDGGAPTLVNTGGAASHGAVWSSPALTRGEHTVVVTRDASSPAGTYVAVHGLLTYDGDENSGLRFLDGSYAGASSNFLTALRVSTFLPPALTAAGGISGLVIIALGTNDAGVFDTAPATYRANIQRLIDGLRAAPVSFAGDFLLLNMVKPSAVTDAEYKLYETEMKALDAGDSKVHYFDLRRHQPDIPDPYTAASGLGLYADALHENSAGHQWIADVLASQLLPS